MNYQELREQLKTGDIVLFSGKGRISRWIRWFCSLFGGLKKIKYSHIGMVIVASKQEVADFIAADKPEFKKLIGQIIDRADDGINDLIMLFESTSIRGGFKGVRLVPLSEVLQTYSGSVTLRQLRPQRPCMDIVALKNFVKGTLGKPYETHLVELMASAVDIVDWYTKDNDTDFFCSELVAAVFKLWRLLPDSVPASEYTPEDFAFGNKVDYVLRFTIHPACLSEEIEVKNG